MLVSRQSPFLASYWEKMGKVGKQGTGETEMEKMRFVGFWFFFFFFFALPIFPFPTAPCLRLRVKYLCARSPPRSQISSLFRALALNTHTYMQLNAGFDFSPGKLEG